MDSSFFDYNKELIMTKPLGLYQYRIGAIKRDKEINQLKDTIPNESRENKKNKIENEIEIKNISETDDKIPNNKKGKKESYLYSIFGDLINRYIIIYLLFLIIALLLILEIIYTYNKYKNNSIKKKCNSGYYLPDLEEGNPDCKKCSIENCEECAGNNTLDFCISCQTGFNPIYHNGIIKSCKNDVNEKCFEYNNDINQCKICNTGYFLAFHSEIEKKCEMCSIENCSKCFGSTVSHICIKCNDGYYIPSDDKTRKNCKKCDIENCEKCIGMKYFNICISCLSGFTPQYKDDKIIKCLENL